MRTESGSIAEWSHLAYIYRSAKYDISNKNDTIFQLCRRTNYQRILQSLALRILVLYLNKIYGDASFNRFTVYVF